MVYDPRTGITTYAETAPQTDVSASAPASPVPAAPTGKTGSAATPSNADFWSGVLGYVDPSLIQNLFLTQDNSQGSGYESGLSTGYVDSGLSFAMLPGGQLGLDNNYKYAIDRSGAVSSIYTPSDVGLGHWDETGNWVPTPFSAYRTQHDLALSGMLPTGTDAHGIPLYNGFSPIGDYKNSNSGLENALMPIWDMGIAALIGAGAGGAFAAPAAGGGSGITAGTTASGIGGGATGTGITVGSTASGIGGGALGTGVTGVPAWATGGLAAGGASLGAALGQGALRGGTTGAIRAIETGQDPLKGAVGGAARGATTAGSDIGVRDVAGQIADLFSSAPAEGGMLPPSTVPEAPSAPGVTNYLTGAGTNTGAGLVNGYSTVAGADSLAGWSPQDVIRRFGAENVLPAGNAASARSPDISVKQAADLARLGATLAQLNGGRATPQGAPQRSEGESDAAYSQQLVQYANLDPRVLAAQGLTAGTPEYYQFVMDQMDSVIRQMIDPSGDLSAQLRTKTDEELKALDRALYVRGQMGQLMGSGQYIDPFTGKPQDVVLPEGQQANPSKAAYEQGLARSADQLATMSPDAARGSVRGMLGRSPDLFNLDAARNAQMLDEMFASQGLTPEEIKRRRGMLAVG